MHLASMSRTFFLIHTFSACSAFLSSGKILLAKFSDFPDKGTISTHELHSHDGENYDGNQDNVKNIAECEDRRSSRKGSRITSFFLSSFNKYTKLLTNHPYPTKIITSGLIGGLGDILIQTVENSARTVPIPFDFRRLVVFSTVAALYIAPVIHIWFDYLNQLPFIQKMSNVKKAAVMMLLDQTIGATVINLFFFVAFEMANYMYPPYNPAKSLVQACIDSATGNIWVTLVANWKCWPVINFVNFLFVPAEFRVLFSNVISVFWNMFLSSVANRPLV